MILLLTKQDNEHADALTAALGTRGLPTVRINVDRVTSGEILAATSAANGVIAVADLKVESSAIRGVFVHQASVDVPDNVGSDSLDRRLIASGWRNWIRWLEIALHRVLWINRPTTMQSSSSPAQQLSSAGRHGLRIPATLFTNDVEALKRFADDHASIVIKSGPILSTPLKAMRILTHEVAVEEIDPVSLRLAPCLFQEHVPKSYELRVHVVGSRVLTCRIDSQATTTTALDWRNYALADTPHYAHELDSRVTAACISIVRDLGLNAGILDLIMTPDGDIVFLECNSQGHWLWIEHLTGLPITEAIVDAFASALEQSDA